MLALLLACATTDTDDAPKAAAPEGAQLVWVVDEYDCDPDGYYRVGAFDVQPVLFYGVERLFAASSETEAVASAPLPIVGPPDVDGSSIDVPCHTDTPYTGVGLTVTWAHL